jgi:AraC family transcriptional regulator, positive regulator of tynA and feaB
MLKELQPALPTLLDLDAVDAVERAPRWHSNALQLFPGLAFDRFTPRPASGVLKHLSLGNASLTYIQSPPVQLRYSPPEAICAGAAFTLAIQLTGDVIVSQHASRGRISAGGVFTIDERFAFRLECSTACEVVLVRMPRQALLAQYPHLKSHTATAMSATAPGTALLREVVLRILTVAPSLQPGQRVASIATIIQMMGMADFGAVSDAGSRRVADRVRSALSFVELSLFEPGFTASTVAAAQGISRRRLDALFRSAVGEPVSAHIWNRRLALAATFLADARQRDQTVAQIANAVGFNDPAHFTRTFKRHFGCCPKHWRQRHAAAAPAKVPSRLGTPLEA